MERASTATESATIGSRPLREAIASLEPARPAISRALLIASSGAAALLAWRLGDPAPLLQADPELAQLLRAMTVLKALIAAAAAGLVFWRLRWPVSLGLGAAYGGGVATTIGATVALWNLEHLEIAALLFHLGAAAIIVAAFYDRSGSTAPKRPLVE